VIVWPAGRRAEAEDGVFEACVASGADWSRSQMSDARAFLVEAWGGDARAHGSADAALRCLAVLGSPGGELLARLTRIRGDGGLEMLRVSAPTVPVAGAAAVNGQRLDLHRLGAAARVAARASLPATHAADPVRVDREALLLVSDPEWVAEQPFWCGS
jgi:hypothetical protein